MRKRLVLSVAVLLIAALAAVALFACKPEDTHKGTQTVNIYTAEDLLKLKDNLGPDFDGFTYELMNDIDLGGREWTPIGTTYNDAFCSAFNGNGHRISGIKIVKNSLPQNGDGQAVIHEGNSTVGFFGFTRNAKIKDLVLDIDYDYVYDAENIYAGGLIGYAFGDTEVSNITVNGNITLKLSVNEDSPAPVEDEIGDTNSIKIYLGGVLGASTGTIKLSGVTSNASLLADRITDEHAWGFEQERERIHTAFVGGVAGYVRTVDLSVKPSEEDDANNIVENLISNGDITVFARRINLGGVIGSLYNSVSAKNLSVGGGAKLMVYGDVRANAGGVIGYADRVGLSEASFNGEFIRFERGKASGEDKIFNIGGLVGHAANLTVITDSVVDTIFMLYEKVDFAGALVGVLTDSGINNCEAKGKYLKVNGDGSLQDIFDRIVELDEESGKYVPTGPVNTSLEIPKWSGAIGKIFGGKENGEPLQGVGIISDLDIDFEAYYAIKCSVVERVKADGEDENGDTIFQKFNSEIKYETINYAVEKVIYKDTEKENLQQQ